MSDKSIPVEPGSPVKKKKKKAVLPRVLLILLLLVAAVFGTWFLLPKKQIKVALIDKTILSYANDNGISKDSAYRKHRGFFWILEHNKYVKPDGSYYDYKKDYYGPRINDEGIYDGEYSLLDIDGVPDLLYLADAYGIENPDYTVEESGINEDDMSVISYSYENGASVIAEMTLFSAPLSDTVYGQLSSMCGVTPTGWLGRYIFDLQDFTDIPVWARPMYERQEGIEWRFSGPGILLVSREGKIIILEQNEDFQSKQLLKIFINDEYKDEFSSCSTTNFYNWFELVEPNYGVESIATFEFDLNPGGMDKIKEISKIPRFTAVTRKTEEGHSPVYYFAGDFNDYTSGERFCKFIFADRLYKFLSFDRQGDITNFYWCFYEPLITKILKNTPVNDAEDLSGKHEEVSRIVDSSFQIKNNNGWQTIPLKAVSINGREPGKEDNVRDMTFYETLIDYADDLGANCIHAKELLPPEFYSVLNKHNMNPKNSPIYLLQSVKRPSQLTAQSQMTDEGMKLWEHEIELTLEAIHGDKTKSEGDGAAYFTDASQYLLAIVADPMLDGETLKSFGGSTDFTYGGEYTNRADGIAGFISYLQDTVQKLSVEKYGYHTCSAVRSVFSAVYNANGAASYSVANIAKDDFRQYIFNDIVFDGSVTGLSEYKGMSPYDIYYGVFSELKLALSDYIISGVSFSNVNSIFSDQAVTEVEQGERIIEVFGASDDAEVLGAVIDDLNDDWSKVSDKAYAVTVPDSNAYLWHNTCDEAEMTGLVAAEGASPEKVGLMLTDDDRVQKINLYSNEDYLFMTLQLLTDIDYSKEVLFVGLDTFQRNEGEYYYSHDFTPNSLSGMEYVLRFDSKQSATMYVIPSYNRTDGTAFTMESYKGDFDTVATLTYGGFSSGDNQFYQTGTTIFVRIPWTWLNVTDPSKKLVINDKNGNGGQMTSLSTNGVLLSVMIGEKESGDLLYAFPEDKRSPGYKVFEWETWDKVSYTFRPKKSFDAVKNYYSNK
ncbi:MAG: hypothetical protein IJT70_03220 [Clostridia bacterium]|nr:hypothetical protein [Clostridia bacterium]